jgi:hypothetical protein
MSPSQGRYLHTGQHKHRIKAHRYQCFKWDSNSRSQYLERAETVHALDRAATAIDNIICNDRLKVDEMDGVYNTHGKKNAYEKLMERNHLGDLNVEGRILKWIVNK